MKRLVLLFGALLCLLSLSWTAPVLAFNPLSQACGAGGGAANSTACGTDGHNPISGPSGVLEKVTLILATIAGVTSIIIVIVSGFSLVTSSGDPQKAASARTAIIGALVGLVLIAAAAGIITFVISKI